MHLSPGAELADRYRLTSRIAVGGMGEVWEATDSRLDRRVAVKVLKPEISADSEFLERFRVEARTAAGLNHPGVAGVYDYGETSSLEDGSHETAFLVMELVDGEALSAVLAREGRLPVDRTLDVLEQTARALQAAHERGVVHRDVKPGNILINPTGQVKITDFGIAKAVDAAPVTRTGMVMGTAQYIAPEQALGQDAGPASDVYSLAVVGHEAVSGARPFVGDNPLTVAMMHIRDLPPPLPGDVPEPVRGLLRMALVKDPAQRYATGAEFADAVAAVRAGRPAPLPRGWAGGDAAAPATAVLGVPTAATQVVRRPPLPPVTTVVAPPEEPWRRNNGGLWILGVLVAALVALVVYAVLATVGNDAPRTPSPTPTVVTPTEAPSSPSVETTTEQPAPTTEAPPVTTPPTTTPPTTTPPTTTPPTTTPPTTTPPTTTPPTTTPPTTTPPTTTPPTTTPPTTTPPTTTPPTTGPEPSGPGAGGGAP